MERKRDAAPPDAAPPDAAPPRCGWARRFVPPEERALFLRLSLWSLCKLCNCTSNRVRGCDAWGCAASLNAAAREQMLQPYAPSLGRLVGLSTESITQLIGLNKQALRRRTCRHVRRR
jgi:hypothetical protein